MQSEIIPLEHLAVLEFSGHDASQFLQAQLTADVDAMADGQAGFACCCNPAGRVLGLMLLRRVEQGWLAICSAELAESIGEGLRRYILRSRVEIRLRADLMVAGVETGVEPPPNAIPFEAVVRYVVAAGESLAGLPRPEGSAGAFRARELLAGIAWLDRESAGQFLPQMLGYEQLQALSFRKGCYPGQEIIARTRYLGKLKRHPLLCLVGCQFEPEPPETADLATGDGVASAVVVDHVILPGHRTLLFLVARLAPGVLPEELRHESGTEPLLWSGPPGPEARLPGDGGIPNQGCATT